MTYDQFGVMLHAVLVFMSGIGLTLLVRAERNLNRYCQKLDEHTAALVRFADAVKDKTSIH
jgi:hypothetical protein